MGNEASGGGDWLAQQGLFMPYEDGRNVAVLFTVKNTASVPVTILSAGDEQPGHRLVRRIGVRFDLVPLPIERPTLDPRLRPPFGAVEPHPLTVPPGREASIQFNFVMGECQFFEPGERRTYNESTSITYRIEAVEKTMRIDLDGDQVTIAAPAADEYSER